ncbi:hypothetical protein ACFFQF_25345 [Haladaptatus pallidirubidus]|uniref:hypothetical protein n=1 Tax=Haladaptatus pallidirubidus TaxID=1008152 RepID=UPI0035E6DB8C
MSPNWPNRSVTTETTTPKNTPRATDLLLTNGSEETKSENNSHPDAHHFRPHG